jgi:hypothetical protein
MPENSLGNLHKIRAKLYANNMPQMQGKYIARSCRAEDVLSVEQVCRSARSRGGFTGALADMTACVRAYHDECAYLVADGFAVENKYFSVHPAISGTFEHPTDAVDKTEHRIDIVHRERSALRRIFDIIEVRIDGLADAGAYISEVRDMDSGAVNAVLTPGGMVVIKGRGVRILGDAPIVGLYFEDAAGSAMRVPPRQLAVNSASELIAIMPPLESGIRRIRIVTQYGFGGNLLKKPREIGCAVDFTIA